MNYIPTFTARKALRLSTVVTKTSLSKTHIYRLIQQGKFPPSYKLSERVSVWDESAIDAWLGEKSDGGAV
jgi:prophage regulatory protein